MELQNTPKGIRACILNEDLCKQLNTTEASGGMLLGKSVQSDEMPALPYKLNFEEKDMNYFFIRGEEVICKQKFS